MEVLLNAIYYTFFMCVINFYSLFIEHVQELLLVVFICFLYFN